MNPFTGKIFLYGPPGSGKTLTGQLLARSLCLPFTDVDHLVEKESGMSIPEIFRRYGEEEFRRRERQVLEGVLQPGREVVALGGGALLDAESRARVQAAGRVICLTAGLPALLERVMKTAAARPLLAAGSAPHSSQDGDEERVARNLANLMERRADHYASFATKVDTTRLSPRQAAWECQVHSGIFRVKNPHAPGGSTSGYEVIVHQGGLGLAGRALVGLPAGSAAVLVSDEQVAPLYAPAVLASLRERGCRVESVVFPPGEGQKTTHTLEMLWTRFIEARLDRSSLVVALGGGVVSDLAGFAAATFLRGISWAALPTTLLAMCDAAIGGKTGVDLPQGKNLIGAFYSPQIVLSDPATLRTLPLRELRSGLAEVVKAGVIDDPVLFHLCAGGMDAIQSRWEEVISRATAVKARVIEADPFEKGERAVLNLGHTVGHAVEWASRESAPGGARFQLNHGEAVAIGMAVEAKLAEELGLAKRGLADQMISVLRAIGLPVEIPSGYSPEKIVTGIKVDKKRRQGQIRFALPVKIGQVKYGIVVEEEHLCKLISSCTAQT